MIAPCLRAFPRSASLRLAIEPSSLPQDSLSSLGGAKRDAKPSTAADAELARQMNGGSEAAFTTFYDRLAPTLFSMIHAILHDQKESEDVLQEAFVQMWKRVGSYDPQRSSLFTWAVMIARHKAIDRLRARQRQFRLTEAVANETGHDTALPPTARADNALAQSDEREQIRAALSQLGDAQREAIDLAFFGGLTQTEISEKLGAPLGTVKARIRRGLLALRDMLGGASA